MHCNLKLIKNISKKQHQQVYNLLQHEQKRTIRILNFKKLALFS